MFSINFVEPIKPPTCHTHVEYTIVVIDYLTKWVEAKNKVKNDARKTWLFIELYTLLSSRKWPNKKH